MVSNPLTATHPIKLFDNGSKLLCFLALLALQACNSSTNYGEATTQIGEVRQIKLDLDGIETVELQLPAADVLISHTDARELSAELTVFCPSSHGRCSQRLDDMAFVSRRQGDRLILDTNKGAAALIGTRQLQLEVFVPRVNELRVLTMAGDVDIRDIVANTLEVDMNAGDLDMSGLQVCPSVNQEAGDVDISLPYHLVSSVDLDVGLGDASLVDRGDLQRGHRSWLVGAELEWRSGNTGCEVLVDLQAGDVQVELTTL